MCQRETTEPPEPVRSDYKRWGYTSFLDLLSVIPSPSPSPPNPTKSSQQISSYINLLTNIPWLICLLSRQSFSRHPSETSFFPMPLWREAMPSPPSRPSSKNTPGPPSSSSSSCLPLSKPSLPEKSPPGPYDDITSLPYLKTQLLARERAMLNQFPIKGCSIPRGNEGGHQQQRRGGKVESGEVEMAEGALAICRRLLDLEDPKSELHSVLKRIRDLLQLALRFHSQGAEKRFRELVGEFLRLGMETVFLLA
ncbi:hypothetical protein GJ744_009376 [Endocarpon pusillum]|uniref:Uncharacterized protein n=1 Tax=Endocarpon pusillum TaxID=364733 RepID=A0A8H7ANP0_9EURO|nr:hypothetical protein GJ744_009376 [Endocarpon pusillum]